MSKRLFKVWSLVLTVMLLASLFVPAAPVQAAYGVQQYSGQTLPTDSGKVLLAGSDVVDYAIGTGVIYSTNGSAVYQSTTGGQTWTAVSGSSGTGLISIAVAPDNSNVVAVANNSTMWISTDAGSTWTALALTGNWAASTIRQIAIAPARSGTLLGREYFAAVADPSAATATAGQMGDVLVIGGNSASWASAGPAGITGSRDYVAIAVTPNFVGDRGVVVIGASATAGTPTDNATGVVVQVIKTTPTAMSLVQTAMLRTTAGTGTTIDFNATPGATNIVAGSVALPTDFDATTSSGIRAYVGFAALSGQSDNDVYRVDNDTAKQLSAGGGSKRINSVSYSGTIAAGTVFAGRYDIADVQYSTDMTSSSPTWTASKKYVPGLGTTGTNMIVVKAAADFATSKTVYGGSTGTPSAFSVSTDGGISFNAKSLIDNGSGTNTLTVINSGPSFDGKTVYIVDNVTAATTHNAQLWKSSVPTGDNTWSLIYTQTLTTSPQISLSPKFSTDATMFFYDKASGGNIWRSADGGATFSQRNFPAGFTPANFAFQDANVGWAQSGNTVYKTTSGGYIWDTSTALNAGTTIGSFGTGRTDELIVGGTGKIAVTKDGGTTYTVTDLGTSNLYKLTKDASYTTNNMVWVLDSTANTLNKFVIGTDTTLTQIPISATVSGGGTIKGIFLRGGALYVYYADRIIRSLNQYDTPGNVAFDKLITGLNITISSATSMTDVDNILYAKSSTNGFVAYDDQMATIKPTVTSPSDNSSLTVNPVSGYASQFNLVLTGTGTGNALATAYEVQITETAIGFNGATSSGAITVTSAAAPQISIGPAGQFVVNLESNKAYQYRVRAVTSLSGESARSLWSDPRNISVASGGKVQETQYGPQLVGPAGGATNVSTTPGFAWAPIFGATKYKFTLATDAALTKTVAGTPKEVTLPSFQVTTALTEGTTYFWSVQVTEPAVGPISVGTFTTAPKVVATTQPTFTIPPQPTPTYTITVPPAPAPTITVTTAPAPAPIQTAPAFIWAIIIIGAVLVIAVIVLIIRTRKTP